ncbi:hypothetical protein NEMIN01_2312 [Nematocida minor]|uniref:uncharacterized protein n=1 Tax=Nematocida minor TaxID=1912983 RepID=UPI00221FEC2B|nr:uncharacterized protein NEMIN01_2312 [Nematocida minor]KAI5192952.1 hypothetical protein NEMIN01_2312 [Nematocida minor]
MDTETIIVFALGMIFYHGVVSAPDEKFFKIASIISLVLFFHKVSCSMHMYEFLQKLPSQKRTILSGVFLFIGILAAIESVVVYMINSFIPQTLIYTLERVGGCFILVSLVLIFSSLWILNRNDIRLCVFIDQGIYAYIRHPYYLGLSFLFVGICLSMGNICSIIIAAIVLKDKVTEFIVDEEDVLVQKHKSYMKYRERVPSGMPIGLLKKIKPEESLSALMLS